MTGNTLPNFSTKMHAVASGSEMDDGYGSNVAQRNFQSSTQDTVTPSV